MMKNIYISFVLICMIFASCKKEVKQNNQTGKKYNVTFGVSNFTQQSTGFQANNLTRDVTSPYPEIFADTATKYQVLYFIQLSDTAGTAILNVAQTEYQGDSDFGTFTTQLIPGTYTYLVVCGENDFAGATLMKGRNLFVNMNAGNISYYNYNGSGNLKTDDFNDFFVKKITFTVTDSPINQNLTLNRLVGKLDVVIKDAIPQNITSIAVTPSKGEIYSTLLGPVNNSGFTDTFPISTLVQETTNYDMAMLSLYTIAPFTVTITAYNGSTVVASKVVSNVTLTRNYITVLEGNLFGGSGSAGGAITVKGDTSWNATTINYHF